MSDEQPTLFENPPQDWRPQWMQKLEGPGQARRTDPGTSKEAAKLITARAGSARIELLEAHGRHPEGLTDEEAARSADLSLRSEYATRCSELMRLGCIRETGETRRSGSSGLSREVRKITPLGLEILEARRTRP
jgi:hypothetical protein